MAFYAVLPDESQLTKKNFAQLNFLQPQNLTVFSFQRFQIKCNERPRQKDKGIEFFANSDIPLTGQHAPIMLQLSRGGSQLTRSSIARM